VKGVLLISRLCDATGATPLRILYSLFGNPFSEKPLARDRTSIDSITIQIHTAFAGVHEPRSEHRTVNYLAARDSAKIFIISSIITKNWLENIDSFDRSSSVQSYTMIDGVLAKGKFGRTV